MRKSNYLIISLMLINIAGCKINLSSNNKVSSSNSVLITNSSTVKKDIIKTIDIYAFNDLHGRISENLNENEPGISKLTSFFKNERSKSDGLVLINSGDYWQDTYESGYNKGKLLSECMEEMKVDTFTLGNHEFDWGIDVIKDNKELSTYTTYLGCNIVDYSTNDVVDFVEPYKIIERNDVKIGIVGAIGRKQLTSITSSNWEDINFLDHTNIVKDLSDELRMEHNCDVVILSIHADESDSNPYEISKVSPVSNEKYFDAVFCAHSHQNEVKYYNDVPFLQGKDHGSYLSYVRITLENNDVIDVEYKNKSTSEIHSFDEDENIKSLKRKYFDDEYYFNKDKVLGKIEGDYVSSTIIGRILAKATYEKLIKNNIEADIVINNGARQSQPGGDITSEKIFNMIPFTNKTIVANKILGRDIINECVNYDNPYYVNDLSLEIKENEYYTVACIDYMMLHKNVYRQYDYFPSFNKDNVVYTIDDYCNKIVEDYLIEHKAISYSDYLKSNYTCL